MNGCLFQLLQSFNFLYFRPLSPCACSLPLLARLMHLLMLAISMVTMDMDILVMPTMDTMDTHMPTTMDTTMARGPLLLSPRLMLMLSTDTDTDLLTTDMAMLTMDTMDMDITLGMPTMDTMDTHMPTVGTSMYKMDIIINLFVKNLGFSSVKLVTPSHIDHC